MTPEEFFNWSKKYPDLGVCAYDEKKVYFLLEDVESLKGFLILAGKVGFEPTVIIKEEAIHYGVNEEFLQSLSAHYEAIIGELQKGVPDLSWATCKQMSNELKRRNNITFVLVWMEENYYDNIHIEASGEANTVIGLATRGLSLLVNATEKRTKIIDSSEEDR